MRWTLAHNEAGMTNKGVARRLTTPSVASRKWVYTLHGVLPRPELAAVIPVRVAAAREESRIPGPFARQPRARVTTKAACVKVKLTDYRRAPEAGLYIVNDAR